MSITSSITSSFDVLTTSTSDSSFVSTFNFAFVIVYESKALLSLIVPTISVSPEIDPSCGLSIIITGGILSVLSITLTSSLLLEVLPERSVAVTVILNVQASLAVTMYLP